MNDNIHPPLSDSDGIIDILNTDIHVNKKLDRSGDVFSATETEFSSLREHPFHRCAVQGFRPPPALHLRRYSPSCLAEALVVRSFSPSCCSTSCSCEESTLTCTSSSASSSCSGWWIYPGRNWIHHCSRCGIWHGECSPAAAAPSNPVNYAGTDACSIHSKAFQDCINNYGSDIRKCQFYSDMLNECRRGSLIISDLMIPRFKFID
ncbi:hypothetical protein OPV22_003456 [Ensete ventricosum]|uniref:CHCH domain-containing protein n=1 Tax=Ensete ventricosum TaxID=4639 RepID=A0AAV8S0W5_ENSVE|nr:hypothetical protein OPV22_003456 [Ensete ventricosum]